MTPASPTRPSPSQDIPPTHHTVSLACCHQGETAASPDEDLPCEVQLHSPGCQLPCPHLPATPPTLKLWIQLIYLLDYLAVPGASSPPHPVFPPYRHSPDPHGMIALRGNMMGCQSNMLFAMAAIKCLPWGRHSLALYFKHKMRCNIKGPIHQDIDHPTPWRWKYAIPAFWKLLFPRKRTNRNLVWVFHSAL